jgi:6-phosphogluconolactonase
MGAALVLRVDPSVRVFPTLAAASRAVADRLVLTAREAVAAHGRFRWVLSGGRTPLPLFRLLGGSRRAEMPWAETEVFFADERCVPPRHPESNFGSAWGAFLSKVPIARRRVHRMRGELRPPSRAASDYARRLGPLPGPGARPWFDAVLLGIGPDGHTASLFPGAPGLRERRRAVIAVRHAGQPPYVPRLTLTLPALRSSGEVLFLVAGRDKAPALREIFRASPRGSLRWPPSLVRSRGTVRWFLDRDAASALPKSVLDRTRRQ